MSGLVDEISIDDIIEIPVRNSGSNQHLLTAKEKMKKWIRNHQWQTLAAVLVLGIIVILSGVFTYLQKSSGLKSAAIVPGKTSTSKWSLSPSSTPNHPVISTTIPTSDTGEAPTLHPTPNPSKSPGQFFSSLKARLGHVFGEDYAILLEDPSIPQGMAYEWILHLDEMHMNHDHPSIVQRYILATFYFASGGRRTSAPWIVCSAVPSASAAVGRNNAFQTRCVTENDTTICAKFQDYEDCHEYYERFELEKPEKQKKRWLSWTPECDWYGIFCDDDGQVIHISLPKNGLEGELVAELSALSKLTTINLRENVLGGTLPSWSALDLEHLSLSDNDLQGTIPDSWMQWTQLETLDLGNNNLTGVLQLSNDWLQMESLILGGGNSLDLELKEKFAFAAKLETLDLSGNFIVPKEPLLFGSLVNLLELNVAGCGLVGSLPELTSLVKLVELQLQNNAFSGSIPGSLWDLTSLEILRLEANSLSGTLSSRIGMLTNLQDVRFSRTGLEGDLPEELSKLQVLERVHLEYNDFRGSIPEELCEVPTLKDLQADCDANGNKVVKCTCCTQCCSLKKEICSAPKK